MSAAVRIGGVRVSVHPGMLVVLAAALYLRMAPEVAVYAAVLLGHELAHVLVAAAFNLKVSALELLPFGGVARVEGLELADPGVEAVVALAGPLHNLLCLAGGFMLGEAGWLAPGRGTFFLVANAALALGNLLPALPLDGGRAVRAGLSLHRGVGPATRWVSGAGLWMGAALLAAGAILLARGVFAPGAFIFGYFTLVRARPEREVAGVRAWREMAGRAGQVQKAGVLPVQHVAADPSVLLRVVVEGFLPRRYHLVWVIDPHGHARGPWDETAVWSALREGGADTSAAALYLPPLGRSGLRRV